MTTRSYTLVLACLLVLARSPLAFSQVDWGVSLLKKDPEWYSSAEAKAAADSVLQYQSPQGGWPKSTDLAKPPRTPEDVPPPGRGRANSLDNEATTLPMQFLARMAHATGEEKYIDSFLRGVDYLLAAQYANGGWPQFWPLRKGYYSHITYNDGAMIRTMTVLRDVAKGEAPYGFVDAERRQKAASAIDRGIQCILDTQIQQGGKRTGWCAQHDENSLKPTWARAYEPPSLSGGETVGIVRFLMSVEEPSDEIKASITGAVEWLQSVQMKSVREERVRNADGRTERILTAVPDAPPLWARFYELDTNRPLYLDRDSVFRYSYSEIGYERRSGYSYHGTWAASLLEKDYSKWCKKHEMP
jgi:PelA/Pel-15E family pectate lyase